MPSITKLLSANKDQEILIGEVVQRQSDNSYQIKIGTRLIIVKSLISERLPINSQVIVIKTDTGYYITNKENIKSRQKIEVIKDG